MRNGSQFSGILKRNNPGKRNREAHCQYGIRQFLCPGKAVNNSAFTTFGKIRVAQNFNRVVFGIAGVNNNWQLHLQGEFQLTAKNFLLHLAGAVIVIIIQPDFAPANHFFMFRKPQQFLLQSVIV